MAEHKLDLKAGAIYGLYVGLIGTLSAYLGLSASIFSIGGGTYGTLGYAAVGIGTYIGFFVVGLLAYVAECYLSKYIHY